MKKTLLSLVMLTVLVAFAATQAQAANPADIAVTVTLTLDTLSVSVDQPTWGVTASGDTLAVVVTNDTSDRTEDLAIVCSGGTNWGISDTAGVDTFVMTAVGGDLAVATSIDTSQTLETDVVAAGTVGVTLEFTAPTSTSNNSDAMTVTVTAS